MTIKEIAQMAGVSNAAVSRYLNGGSLSQEKRATIAAVIRQTGYRPAAAAQTQPLTLRPPAGTPADRPQTCTE